jgi:exoribonuclease R
MSSFKIKLDENLAQMHVDLLKEAGYDADRVHDEGLSGTTYAHTTSASFGR